MGTTIRGKTVRQNLHGVRLAVLLSLGAIVFLAAVAGGAEPPSDPATSRLPRPAQVFVPYSDLASIVDPSAKAVLMDRAEFQKLLDAAQARPADIPPGVAAAEVMQAEYAAEVVAGRANITGTLAVRANTDKPVAVALPFGQIGLTSLNCDGQPAPLGYDAAGKLVLIVSGKDRKHTVTLEATAVLKDLASGGSQFALAVPPAAAGTLAVSAGGDLDIVSNAPLLTSPVKYDKQADRTAAKIAIGGYSAITVLLLGNGRQDDVRGILLGESVTQVRLSPVRQEIQCLYSVQILRRAVRELRFAAPADWTVSDVACDNLVKWSIEPGKATQTLVVQLAGGNRTTVALHIQASAPMGSVTSWSSPMVSLVGGDFQRGFLSVSVDSGSQLRIRGPKVADARQMDPQDNLALARWAGGGNEQWFYHWGDRWSVRLALAPVKLGRSSDDRQTVVVGPSGIVLAGTFNVTAVGREMFDVSFELPPAGWDVAAVTVNDQPTGFQYHVSGEEGDSPLFQNGLKKGTVPSGRRVLRVDLPSGVAPEGVVRVGLTLRHVPRDWDWSGASGVATTGPDLVADADSDGIKDRAWILRASRSGSAGPGKLRKVAVSLIRPMCDTVSGVVGIVSSDDLDVSVGSGDSAIGPLKPINVGRMVSLGLGGNVRLGYTYDATPDKAIDLSVSRQAATVRAASIGLASLAPTGLTEDWLIQFFIARGRVNRLYLLADKSMGERAQAALQSAQGPAGLRIISRRVVPQQEWGHLPARNELLLRANYDIWELTLDADCVGLVPIRVHYDQPVASKPSGAAETQPAEAAAAVPLIRPGGVDQADELVAVQASPGYPGTVHVESKNVTEIDPIELPALQDLPVNRVLAAFRIGTTAGAEEQAGKMGGLPQISLVSAAHKPYELAGAIVTEADMVTLVGPPGETSAVSQATFLVVNAGLQFFRVQLPAGATLWSIRLNGQVIKPSRDTAGNFLVSLPTARAAGQGNSAAPSEVRVVYADKVTWSDRGRVAVAAPMIPDAQVNRSTWKIVPAVGYHVDAGPARMEPAASGRPALAINDSLASLGHAFTPQIVEWGAPRSKAEKSSDRSQDDEPLLEARARVMVPDNGELAMGGQRMSDRISAPSSSPDGIAAPKIIATGRVTLPIDLPPVSEAGSMTFSGLGLTGLTVDVVEGSRGGVWLWMGFVLTGLLGLAWINRRPWRKIRLILTVMLLATSAALVSAPVTQFANGAFYAALALIPFYILIGVYRWVHRSILEPAISRSVVNVVKKSAVLLAVALMIPFGSLMRVQAGGPTTEPPAPPAMAPVAPIVIPYDGDPFHLDKSKLDKVLVPFDRFVELWNRAHPDRPMLVQPAAGRLLISGAKFEAAIVGEKLDVTLSATIQIQGGAAGAWETLPLPMENLAVTEATLDGKPVRMQTVVVRQPLPNASPGKDVQVYEKPEIRLLLQGGQAGRLVVKAVGSPRITGQRGAIDLVLPPMPAAVMTLKLPAEDLLLETEGSDGAIVQDKAVWTIPLNLASRLSLKWSPKSAGTSADRTLSAVAEHSVYAFDWALVGVSKLSFTFSAGDYDRFSIFVPANVTVTDIAGANFRDQRIAVDSVVLDGQKFREISVRLYKPASGRQDFSVKWLAKLPASPAGPANNTTQPEQRGQSPFSKQPEKGDSPLELLLPRAGGVGRESGTVALFASSGVTMLVADVAGGRRVDQTIAPPIAKPTTPQAEGRLAAKPPSEQPIGESASAVGQYYWPYRPFAIKVRLSSGPTGAAATARLDQLVRITAEQTQLDVTAYLRATGGKVFSANFRLPDGFDVLTVTEANVGDWYIEPAATPAAGRQLHVALTRGATDAKVTISCVRPAGNQGKLDPFAAPMLTAIDADGNTLRSPPGEPSRLAVQVAPAMEANTLASENLKPVVPNELSGWLAGPELSAVQFAYRYETPAASLQLAIRPRVGKVRVEIATSLAVQPGDPPSAWYTCRLRYTIEAAPVDRVSFDLPERFSRLASLNPSPAIRSVSQAEPVGGRVRWTVLLANEWTGQLDLTLNFVVPVDRATQTLDVPRVSTSAPDGYRAIVAVQNFSRHDLSIAARERLTELPSAGVQSLLGQATRSLVGAFDSFTDDWSLSVKLTPVATIARPKIIVDLMAITSVVDLDGNARYRVALTVSNRTEQFLPIKLPAGFRVWSADVAGVPVRPAIASYPEIRGMSGAVVSPDQILVPLVKTGGLGQPYDVRLLVAGRACEPLGQVSTIALPAVRVGGDIQVVRSTWSVRLPGGYMSVARGGNMAPVAGKGELLAYQLQADSDNLKRLREARGENFSGSSRGQWIEDAWVVANREFDRKSAGLESYLNSRESATFDKDSRAKIFSDWKAVKDAAQEQREGWAQASAKEAELNARNFNYDLNGVSQTNLQQTGTESRLIPGRSESARNAGLTAIPQFVQRAADIQSAQVGQDLVKAKADVATLQAQSQLMQRKDAGGKQADGSVEMAWRQRTESEVAGDREKAISVDTQSLLAQAELGETVGKLLEDVQLVNAKRQEEKLASRQAALNDNRMQRWYGSRTGNSLGATDSGQSAQGQGNPVNAPGGGGGDGGFSYATGNVFNGGNGLGRNPSVQVNGGGTVTVGGSNSYSFNGALIANGTITGSSTRVGGTELGVGTITLSGNNTYTGGTTVNGGTVVVGNSGQINWNPNSYAGKPSSGSGPNLNEAAPSHARPAMREAVGELFALHVGDEMSRDSLSDLSIPGRADSGGMDHASGAEFAGRRTGRPVTEGKEQVLGRATAATPQYETRTEGRSTPGTNVWLHARAVETDRANQAIISDVVDARRSHESAPARSAGLVAAEIELPAGGVELDYGCPSGQPELTLTIVREDLVTGGWGLATALIGLAVLALAAMIGRRVRRKG